MQILENLVNMRDLNQAYGLKKRFIMSVEQQVKKIQLEENEL